MQRTYVPKIEEIERAWYVVDATDLPLGRLASEVAKVLRGKHKPMFTPHLDTGDHVIVVNADKVRITSKKSEEKIYYRHSGYPGGIKAESFNALLERRPEAVIERAIKGMLPKNRLGRAIYRKLHVYAGDTHPHESQKPEALTLDVKKVDG